MGIFRLETTKIVEANDPEDAARKVDIKPNECRITDITKDLIRLQDMGDLEILKGDQFTQ